MHNWHGFKAFQVGSGHEPNGFTPSNWPYKYANPALAFQARMGRIAASRCLIDTPLAQQNQAAAAILGTDARVTPRPVTLYLTLLQRLLTVLTAGCF